MKTKNYNKDTKAFIKDAKDYLKKRYGMVNPEWESMLYMYADNLDLYHQIKESIEENGIYDAETGKKNPLLTTLKDLQATMFKQIQHLGLSPYASSKIKQAEEDDSNLLSAIMGEEDND